MFVTNTDPRFGIQERFEAESVDTLAVGLLPLFQAYAQNAWSLLPATEQDAILAKGDKDSWLEDHVSGLDIDFRHQLLVEEPKAERHHQSSHFPKKILDSSFFSLRI